MRCARPLLMKWTDQSLMEARRLLRKRSKKSPAPCQVYATVEETASQWPDAEAAVHQRTELAPALKEQLELAKKAAEAAEQGFKDAEQALQSATSALNN